MSKKNPVPVEKMMEMAIHRDTIKLVSHTFMVMTKFEKKERYGMRAVINNKMMEVLELEMMACRAADVDKRAALDNLLFGLLVMRTMTRVAYEAEYIGADNLEGWLGKIWAVEKIAMGWRKRLEAAK
jgi:hypothetical protein